MSKSSSSSSSEQQDHGTTTTTSSSSSASSTTYTTTATSKKTTNELDEKNQSSSSSSSVPTSWSPMMNTKNKNKEEPSSLVRWFLGMCLASIFSMIYYIAPIYMLTALFSLLFAYPSYTMSWIYATPILLSAIIPPIPSPYILKCVLRPILDYFDFEQINEQYPINVSEEMISGRTQYLCIMQPHGVFSYVGLASAIAAPKEFQGILPTAVADAVLHTPILKHVMGIFNLISASKNSLRKRIQNRTGVEGSIVLYVGGMAELFLSSANQEVLYLKKRKGFIKLAMQEGIDIIPVYLFGNTAVLSIYNSKLMSEISRKLQISLTYMWGKYYLPIPRDCKLLYVSGQPIGIPHIEQPTIEDIEKWHTIYCNEVIRLFNKYKEKVPQYKHKQLIIT